MRIRSRELRGRITAHLESRDAGFTADDGILISYEEVEDYIPRRKRREWDEGWDVSAKIDRWTAIALHGYDSGDNVA